MAELIFPLWGKGTLGSQVISSNTNYTLTAKGPFAATSGALLGTTDTAKAFTAGMCFIHQSLDNTNGNYGLGERNYILSYNSGTGQIAFALPVSRTYTSGAQIVQIPEYTDFKVNSGISFSMNSPWNGVDGGILPMMVSGTLDISGTFQNNGLSGTAGAFTIADGGGFRAGQGAGQNTHLNAYGGEGYTGFTGQSYINGNACNAINNGGAGGAYGSSPAGVGAGGGGGNGTVGANGNIGSGGDLGRGGFTAGTADLVRMLFGGGGGGGASGDNSDGVVGGNGGGIIIIWARRVKITGLLSANGGAGANAIVGGARASGGGGAGGSILIFFEEIDLGNGLVVANGGAAGVGGVNGGAGGDGRITLAGCRINDIATADSNPNYTLRSYQSFCGRIGVL